MHFTALLKNNLHKIHQVLLFSLAYVMKTVSSSHFQFPLKPCGRLKINLKIGKSIWLKLNCGYCNHHKFFLSKITLREAYKLLSILPSNISSLNTVMDSIRICRWRWLNCLLVPSFPLNGNYDSYSLFSGYMMSWDIFVCLSIDLLTLVSMNSC